jgi:TatD DNase family protein
VLIDSHCHVTAAQFDADRPDVLARAGAAGVSLMICPGTGPASIRAALALARAGAAVAPAAGIHPNELSGDWSDVAALASEPEIVAIGETGLDYYRGRDAAVAQRRSFLRHLALAGDLGLPVIVHNRAADDDVLRALADWRGTAILHCFVGTLDLAERALALGCYLGIGGPLTFKSSGALRETVAHLPLDRLLVETDAPFLAPAPHRGQRNEPAHVRLVAQKLAELRALPLDEVARVTAENARRVFRLDGRPTAPGQRERARDAAPGTVA